jgi:hypothetical protein
MAALETPLQAITVIAAAAITARRFVAYDDALAGTAGEKVLGVAQTDAESGAAVAVITAGTAIVETGGAFSRGDSLITDAQGRAVAASGALGVASGATAVTSTAADGAVLEGADLPEFVIADALADSGGAGELVEIKLR